jgi:chemotaxis protein histidine kinase CheA
VPIAQFEERLAKVRHRFASTLEGKIQDTYGALPLLSSASEGAFETLEATYRRIHGICGVGPTVGFPRTGKAAREAEAVLLEAYHAHRGLNEAELNQFRKKLHELQEAAKAELQSTFVGLR